MDKILLIDDEHDILRVLAMSLRADGYEVLTAENGEAGLAVFDAQAPDIVLVDIKMPWIGGIEVLQEQAEQGRGQAQAGRRTVARPGVARREQVQRHPEHVGIDH